MTVVTIPTEQQPRIQPNNLTRNGKPVSMTAEQQLRRVANQVLAYEGKELFSAFGIVPCLDSSPSASRTRWRFRGKVSPHVTQVQVMFRMAMQNDEATGQPAGTPSDAAVKFELFDAANAVIGTVEHHYGSQNPLLKPADTPDTWNIVFATIDVTGGDEVHGLFTELNQGRLISALVYELGPAPDTDNGYLGTGPGQGSNIYADERARLIAAANDTWLGGGAQALNLNCNDDGSAFTLVGSTPTNIIDTTSTTISAATPGIFFDGTGKGLDNAGGVLVELWAYGSTTDEAYVELKDSTGAIVGNVTFTGGTAAWHSSGPFLIPTTAAKYDVHAYSTTGETINLWTVSLYEVG